MVETSLLVCRRLELRFRLTDLCLKIPVDVFKSRLAFVQCPQTLRQAFDLNFELRSVQIGRLEGFILLEENGLEVLELGKQRGRDFRG
jgi:hypothetical protein